MISSTRQRQCRLGVFVRATPIFLTSPEALARLCASSMPRPSDAIHRYCVSPLKRFGCQSSNPSVKSSMRCSAAAGRLPQARRAMQSSAATWRGQAWTCDGDSVTFAVAAAGPWSGAPGAKVTGERDRARMSGSITQPDEAKIRVGVSACLVGDKVRYDGGHKRDVYLTGKLAQVYEFMPVCPVVAFGMGVPRPPIRLVGDALAPRALGVEDALLDVTAPLTAYGRRMAVELDGISAYIFKARSPSCGPWRVPIYSDGVSMAQGTGLYAREIRARQSLLPVEEEGRLADPSLRDNFIEPIIANRPSQQQQTSPIHLPALVQFHSPHNLQFMSHGAVYY